MLLFVFLLLWWRWWWSSGGGGGGVCVCQCVCVCLSVCVSHALSVLLFYGWGGTGRAKKNDLTTTTGDNLDPKLSRRVRKYVTDTFRLT